MTRRKGKNSRIALLTASVLTLASISCFVLAVWRLGMDLNFAADFVFTSGLASHWQVWMAAAALSQYACWRLNRYARQAEPVAISVPVQPAEALAPQARAAVNV